MTKNNSDKRDKFLARISYSEISNGQFSDEYIVKINIGKDSIVGIFPSDFVDKKTQTIIVYVVKEAEDKYLLSLPSTTFTTSSNVWFPKQSVSFEAGLA